MPEPFASQLIMQAITLAVCLLFSRDCVLKLTAVLAIYAAQLAHIALCLHFPAQMATGDYYFSAGVLDGLVLVVLALMPPTWFRTKLVALLGVGLTLNAVGLYGYEAGWAVSETYSQAAMVLFIAQTALIATGGGNGDIRMAPRDFVAGLVRRPGRFRARAGQAMGGGKK